MTDPGLAIEFEVPEGLPPAEPVSNDAGPTAEPERPFSMSLEEFIALERADAEPLLADADGKAVVACNSLTFLGALGGGGKTTWALDLFLHMAAGVNYPPFTVPRPVSILIIENEGPEKEFSDKLKARWAAFPHELRARLGVYTFDWGGFTLADGVARERLRQNIALHEYDMIFGDPLDSLGVEGVGSPEDTRKFLALMQDTGLHQNVAWWINTHPRKEETKEALNEIAGAWGGKPDAVFLLTQLADDRTRVRQPKLRWAKRGRGPTLLFAFDAETESFSYLGQESEEERDYMAEVSELLADGKWRTVAELVAPKAEGGIGCGKAAIKGLEDQPDRFVSRTGRAAQEVGRHPNATVWGLGLALNPDDPDALEMDV